MAIKKSDSSGVPFGNNAGRPANPGIGRLYSNGEEKRLELYTSSGWQNIVSETPGVVSVSGSYLESVGSATLDITGTNFTTGAIASVIGTNGVEVNANSTTVNSIVSVSAVFTGLSNAYEPYDLKITNTSNLFGLLPDALYINANPVWQTSAGSLGTFADNVAVSVSATATDDSTITYSLASGSTLPSGVTLNSSTGLISGTLPDIASNTTYTFTINASDGANPAVPRTFSIVSNAAPVWVTSAGSLGSFLKNTSITTSALSVTDSDTVSYALASGSSLPSGLTLNSSTGVISGTLPDIATDTTYTFTINTLDGVSIIPRTFSITSNTSITAEYLVVAGGGGGGGGSAGGGGGAGGFKTGTLLLTRNSSYLATVGLGGAGKPGNTNGGERGSSGENSVFSSVTSTGGGGGGGEGATYQSGGSGGSGGGADYHSGQAPGTGISGQGNNGGYGNTGYWAGGGGGAGAPGGNASYGGSSAGAGGAGLPSSITGAQVYYAGGGGGATQNDNLSGGAGGIGGGGQGAMDGNSGAGPSTGGISGTPNTGGGGGGNPEGVFRANVGNGGSGVVVIAYPNTYPAITTIPGTLTYDQPSRSGYRVYRFTAGSGTITI